MDVDKNAKEMIENFGDMVNATEKLTKPWRIALLITNLLWAIVFSAFILLAYLTPSEISVDQGQDFSNQTQNYTSTVTDGK